jgi:hypothetical protein
MLLNCASISFLVGSINFALNVRPRPIASCNFTYVRIGVGVEPTILVELVGLEPTTSIMP